MLVFGGPADEDLMLLLAGYFPEGKWVNSALSFDEVSRSLQENPGQGLLCYCQELSPAELSTLGAQLEALPNPVLLIEGPHGFLGGEALLRRSKTHCLPLHWTPRILRAILSLKGQAETPLGPFLQGLIEGFRDPLTSISGYIQLLRAQDPEGTWVTPALEATRELDDLLEVLHLISPQRTVHRSELPLASLVEDSLRNARRRGVECIAPVTNGGYSQTDGRLAQAALDVSFLWLQRFGPPGTLSLLHVEAESAVTLAWKLVDYEPPEKEKVSLPVFLETLLRALSEKMGAQAVIQKEHGIPVFAGVRFQNSAP